MPRKYASKYSIAGSDSTQLLSHPYGHVYGKDIKGDGQIVISNGPRRERRREFHSQTIDFFLISYACLCHQNVKSIKKNSARNHKVEKHHPEGKNVRRTLHTKRNRKWYKKILSVF